MLSAQHRWYGIRCAPCCISRSTRIRANRPKDALVVVQQLVKPAGQIFIEPIGMLNTWAIDHAAELDALTTKQAADAHLAADAPEQTHPPKV